jgi:hypothetical protein
VAEGIFKVVNELGSLPYDEYPNEISDAIAKVV